MTVVALDLARHQIPADGCPRLSVDDGQVEHLRRVKSVTVPASTCRRHRLVGAQEVLSGLATGVKVGDCAADDRLSSRPPYSRANGTPCATQWSIISTLSWASRKTFASASGSHRPSRCRKEPATLSPSFR